jgi:hypothetical protein
MGVEEEKLTVFAECIPGHAVPDGSPDEALKVQQMPDFD